MKLVNLILAALYLLFAFVQVNDPDPVRWILIYGVLAVSCILAAFGVYYRLALLALLVLCSVYAVALFPGVQEWMRQDNPLMLFDGIARMEYPFVEEAREFLGLFICIAVLVMHLIRSRRVAGRT